MARWTLRRRFCLAGSVLLCACTMGSISIAVADTAPAPPAANDRSWRRRRRAIRPRQPCQPGSR